MERASTISPSCPVFAGDCGGTLAGARPREHEALSNLFRALLCVPIDGETGCLAGAYLRDYRKSRSVELGDALIAATAVLNNSELWTRNRKHYPMRDV